MNAPRALWRQAWGSYRALSKSEPPEEVVWFLRELARHEPDCARAIARARGPEPTATALRHGLRLAIARKHPHDANLALSLFGF